ncbi:MAG: glycosyltransferase family A protein [Pseudomonadota bacterium]
MPESVPTVSVIVPTYNRADVLPRAINSILRQSFQDFEIIVVDDGSIDDTGAVVSQYLDRPGSRVRYAFQKHTNVASARNLGIRLARGSYIAFLDSDDEWFPAKLQKQVAYLDSNKVGFVHTGRNLVCMPDNSRSRLLSYPQTPARSSRDLLAGTANVAMTVVVRRTMFEDAGVFDEGLDTTQDLDLWLRIARRFEIGFIDEELMVSYKLADSNMAADPERTYLDRITIFRKLLHVPHPLIVNRNWNLLLATHSGRLALEKFRKRKVAEGLYWANQSLRARHRWAKKRPYASAGGTQKNDGLVSAHGPVPWTNLVRAENTE